MKNKLTARQYPWFLLLAFVGGIVTDVCMVFGFFLGKPKNMGDVLVIAGLGAVTLFLFQIPSMDIMIKNHRRKWKGFLLRWFWLPMAACSILGMMLSQAIIANFYWEQSLFFGITEGVSLFLTMGLARMAHEMRTPGGSGPTDMWDDLADPGNPISPLHPMNQIH